MSSHFITKLKRETLTDQVGERLSQFVQARGLQPGDTLPSQAELAKQFGVSRTVVREALQSLVGSGFIEIVNGKGAVIRPTNSKSLSAFFQHAMLSKQQAMLDLMEVRRALEVQAAILAAQRRTTKQLEDMLHIVTEMRGCLSQPSHYTDLDLKLHLTIAKASHNTMLVQMVETIRESSKAAIHLGLLRQTTPQERKRIQTEHEAVVQAIQKQEPTSAQTAMENHFDKAVMSLVQSQASAA